ncbi:MAG: hypothetical protein ACO1SX_00315 [Actinomycetota bacterium]
MLKPITLTAALLGVLATGPAWAQTDAAPGAAPPKPARPMGGVPVEPAADLPAEPFTVPAAAGSVLDRHLASSRPTIFIFTKPSSSLERQFVQEVCRGAGRRAGVGVVNLVTGSEPAAKKYEITETPTALVYDRRGRFVSRSSDPDQIRASILKAVAVPRIDWPALDDPRALESAKILGRPVTGGIMRTMTFQPEWLGYINGLARKAHFSPGYLDVRTKEMIAAYVSALNDCRF